jgi:hypothetical protein
VVAILTHRYGEQTPYTSDDDLDALLDELADASDAEHSDVAVTHESGWTLGGFTSGRLIWENVESEAEPRHAVEVSPTEMRRLFGLLAQGAIGRVEASDWKPGY